MLRFCAKKIIIAAVIFLLTLPSPQLVLGEKKGPGLIKNGREVSALPLRAVAWEEGNAWSVAPQELDLGRLEADHIVNGLITLKNAGAGSVPWSLEAPEGWGPEEAPALSGDLKTGLDYLRISLRSSMVRLQDNPDGKKVKTYNIQLRLEAGAAAVIYQRSLPLGDYREQLHIILPGSVSMISLKFKVAEETLGLVVGGSPRLDFGIAAPGRQLERQIKIANRSRETVKWRIIVPAGRRSDIPENLPPLKGRYVSFLNEENKGGAVYAPPPYLKDVLELSGKWLEHAGYPSASGSSNQLKFHFSGTGIGAYLWHGPDGGRLAAYLDDQLIYVYDGNYPERGREELPLVDGLSEGLHVLTFLNGEGRTVIEGVNIYGKELKKGNPGWIHVTPDSGTTTRETDYANIRLDTQQLHPGQYGEQILIDSSQGDIALGVFVEIIPEQTLKFFDIYRYVNKRGYLYTNNPQAEANQLASGGYRKEGIAFRLFATEAPGTTKFYRWYNGKNGDHYYSYDFKGGGKSLAGYVFEGSIGNIATSRLTNTRELYRWYNSKTGAHFYTTDQKGEGLTRKGYKFDGIAGYVR